MLLHIVARGKIGRGPEAELVERYLKRIAWPTQVTELPESGGRLPPPAESGVTILLDEKGEQLGSIEFAPQLERWRDDGRREARFLIGGADGFDDADARRAPTCSSPSAGRPGRTCSPGRCSPSNCGAPPASLRTTPIIGKDRRMRSASSLPADRRSLARRRPGAAAQAAAQPTLAR